MSKIALVYGILNNTNIRVVATVPSIDGFVKAIGSDVIDWRDRRDHP